ncbi:GNAT family protein [Paenibacillus sp. Marseille-Q4541]|uniref:GNAT family N-acetyltransferase n=1 Tax=Paenibacillus sp. Marseille-Q4541 TaxID=2831522 RepID=UPI001BAD78A1|nr:GNAT family protein [Paenibacillus sp. Marseille-Q4541]
MTATFIPKALQGQKVYLKPVNASDAEAYYQLLFDAETSRLTGTKAIFNFEQITEYIDRKWRDDSSVLLLIARQETDELIGDIALQDLDYTNRSANLRIMIDQAKHQGQGFGTEALRLILDYAFGILQLHRVELNVYDFNERAAHVYKKVGFKIEGRQRDALFYNHEYHDAILMSMLEEEYREKYLTADPK